jgi:hypothetical protein
MVQGVSSNGRPSVVRNDEGAATGPATRARGARCVDGPHNK